MSSEQIDALLKERNELLIRGDVDGLIKFLVKMGEPRPRSRLVAEVTLHKARVNMPEMPRPLRVESAKWLRKNGFSLEIT